MLKLIDPDQALELVLGHALPARVKILPVPEAHGLSLAEEIFADRDYPPFSRAMMDGYAVTAADAGKTVELVGEVAAGQETRFQVSSGRCVSIMTGAACPEGTEAVVKIEDTQLERQRVTLPASITMGQHIAPKGSECARGATALVQGGSLTPLSISVLAAVGRQEVKVLAPPAVAIITTGNELARGGAELRRVQIRDTNGPMLAALARQAGVRAVELARAEDTPESLAAALGLTKDVDLVLITGGVSAGKYDLVPGALAQHGAELIFHKVTQKPGKPLLFGKRDRQLIFGLPGNPLSCHFCWHRYVRPAARQMMGLPPEVVQETGTLESALQVRCTRTLFTLAHVSRRSGRWGVAPRIGQGSADIFSGAIANAFIRLEPGEHKLERGTTVAFQRMGAV